MTNDRPTPGYGIPLRDGTDTYTNAPDPKTLSSWRELDEATNLPPEQKPEDNTQPAQTNYNPNPQRR